MITYLYSLVHTTKGISTKKKKYKYIFKKYVLKSTKEEKITIYK